MGQSVRRQRRCDRNALGAMMGQTSGWKLTRGPLYRSFRRRLLLATAVLFALGLVTALLLRDGGSLWAVVLGTAVCSPLVVVVAVVLLLPLRRMAGSLGLAEDGAGLRLRPTAVVWMMAAILLPWIAAWLVADLAGNWLAPDGGGGLYLWIVRLIAGLGTYSLASALGVLLAFMFDRSLGAREGGEPS
jgi:hypothetical protein